MKAARALIASVIGAAERWRATIAGCISREFLMNANAELRSSALERVRAAASPDELEAVRIALLGKKGEISQSLRALGALPIEERREQSSFLNPLKTELEALIAFRQDELTDSDPATQPRIDMSLPAIPFGKGGLHPIVQMIYDLNDAFSTLNFDVYDGPEITSELYEFDNLNFPPEHPARESMDTYWLEHGMRTTGGQRLCLRPHLTGASVRYMQTHEAPFRFVYPGRVYRNESTDARHERAFFQYEALIVDRHIPFSSGKLLIETILSTVFGREVTTRMRAGFFPFVEPGFEIDMLCLVCNGAGCRVCKNVGWLEIMPGGAPHPNVLKAGGINSEEWTGFYINVGMDRLVMMRYGIDDVRLFHGADLKFLAQFR